MKDPKEEASHRILNLKNMMHNVKEERKSADNPDEDDLEEDEELIRFLNERHQEETYEMDDSFIYHPGKNNVYEVNLDDDIDENFIIKTNANEESDEFPYSEKTLDYEEKIGENFDNIVNMKIHEKPVLGMLSLIVGIMLIIFSIIVLNSGTDRIVDNVVSGENNYITVVLLILGSLLIIYGIFKIFNIKSPFNSMMESIENIEEDNSPNVKGKLEEPSVPKSNIPLDKESLKVGEFDINELKTSLKKPFIKRNKVQETEEINIEELPLAREKSKDEKGLIKEEIEEKNYKQAKLDGESIDEIFSQVRDFEKKR